ncbi:MAG: DoxX family protein [Prevotellaceae bacterium]|jgi:triosephosphate isomerase|nr:DoxX family protein [Prevotellaceae bacterium]
MKIKCILRTVVRIAVGLLFIFSGYVKAIDPIGSEIKFGEYFEAFGMSALEPAALVFGILLAAAELIIGLCFFFGLRMKLASLGAILFMVFMTGLTLILAITDAVQDCGCFGDAIKLTNWQTFYKNLIIMPFVIYAFIERKNYRQIFDNRTEWIIAIILFFASSSISIYAYRHLPLIDFMAYKAGVNIPEGMIIPEGAPSDIYEESKFIYEKDGQRKIFTLENLPDSTWKYIDSPAPKLLKKGYVPPTKDFSITSIETRESVHENIFAQGGYLFFITSANIIDAKLKNPDILNDLYKYSAGNNINFIMLSGSSEQANLEYRQKYGAEYSIYSTDATVLKSMVRSNPGIMLLKDNIILKKWNIGDAPSVDELKTLLSENPEDIIAGVYARSKRTTVLFACMVFVLFVFFSWRSFRNKH